MGSFDSRPESVHVSVDDDEDEGDDEVEDQPDVNHLDVGRRGQALGHADEQSRDDEEHCHVRGDEALEEELLEVVGHVADDVDDQGRQEGGQDDAQQPPLDRHLVFKIQEKETNQNQIKRSKDANKRRLSNTSTATLPSFSFSTITIFLIVN